MLKAMVLFSCTVSCATDLHICFRYIIQPLCFLNPIFQASIYLLGCTACFVPDPFGNLKTGFLATQLIYFFPRDCDFCQCHVEPKANCAWKKELTDTLCTFFASNRQQFFLNILEIREWPSEEQIKYLMIFDDI